MKVGNLQYSAFRLPLDGKVYDKLTDGHIPLNGLLEVYIVHFSVNIYKKDKENMASWSEWLAPLSKML